MKKCFSYTVRQNKDRSADLTTALKRIPDHFFGAHENCGTWCKQKTKHTILLSDNDSKVKLMYLFNRYAANSHQFSIAASNQTNEAFNNIVAHQARKNECLSKSAANDFRVADSVCVLNDGEKSILNYRETLGLPTGFFTSKYVVAADRKRIEK